MQLIFLGTASCYPTASRAVSCTAVRFEDGDVWLFDCGEGSQIQVQKSKIHPGKIKKIFITHLHGDHLFGLPGIICTLGSQMNDKKENFLLEIYGPLGLRRYVRENLNLSRSPLPFKYRVHELIPDEFYTFKDVWNIKEAALSNTHPEELPGDDILAEGHVWNVLKNEKICVYGSTLKHRIPCFGYVIKENSTPGSLDVGKLLEEGVRPGPLFKQIKDGNPIVLETGKVINPEDVLGPSKPGRTVTILGDTCDSSRLNDIALNSDVLVHEATLEDGLQEKAIENGHSTPSMAVSFAQTIQAKKLVLFHYSQRYKRETENKEKSVNILQKEAEGACRNKNFDCEIILADDLLEMDVKRPLKLLP